MMVTSSLPWTKTDHGFAEDGLQYSDIAPSIEKISISFKLFQCIHATLVAESGIPAEATARGSDWKSARVTTCDSQEHDREYWKVWKNSEAMWSWRLDEDGRSATDLILCGHKRGWVGMSEVCAVCGFSRTAMVQSCHSPCVICTR